jgi:hypothetical protein
LIAQTSALRSHLNQRQSKRPCCDQREMRSPRERRLSCKTHSPQCLNSRATYTSEHQAISLTKKSQVRSFHPMNSVIPTSVRLVIGRFHLRRVICKRTGPARARQLFRLGQVAMQVAPITGPMARTYAKHVHLRVWECKRTRPTPF